jgi:hypothetical protein
MKKKLAIITALMMVVCFAFASCGGGSGSSSGGEGEDLSDSKYVGVWVADSFSIESESEDTEGGTWKLTLNGDGTGTFYSRDDSDGTEETTDITWELTSDGFKTKGDTKLTFTDDGDGIKTKIMGVEIAFVREGEESSGESEGSEEAAVSDGAKYGYAGNDPVEAAVYKYLAEEVSASYQPPADAVSIPVVQIIDLDVDSDDGDAEVSGDFWVLNYTVEGDTLKCISGGAHPGKMDLVKDGDVYVVEEFEVVEDGANYESSAKDIFEERYDEFSQVSSDDTTREKVRAEIIANYVKANGLEVTKYQDEGWDPVDLAL